MTTDLWGGAWAGDTTTPHVCGTGGWAGPKPGDPDNNSLLSATPAFGGIDVSWTYPITNPFAVAHTLLFRSTSNDFATAVQLAVVAGNFFYDKSTTTLATEYFYWIKIVSINGTVGATIGPASATAKPTIENMLELLTGEIDAGLLAQSLKTDITNIGLLGNSITEEIQNRLAAMQALSGQIGTLQGEVDQAITFIEQEVTQRVTDNSSTVESLTLMGAGFNDAVAGLAEEIVIRTGPDSALAQSIQTVEATLNGNTATGQVGLVTEVNGITGNINAMYTAKVQVNGLIGGFGIINDGNSVEAGFDVDRFWVGRTGPDKIKPFIIDAGVVYINEAAIKSLTFSKLRDESGSFIVENGKVKAAYLNVGEILGGSFTGYAWPASGDGFYLGPSGLLLGRYSSGQYFQVGRNGNIYAPGLSITGGNASFSGHMSAKSFTTIGNKFTASEDGTVVADLVDIRRRLVLETGTLDPTDYVVGTYPVGTYIDDGGGKGTYANGTQTYPVGTVLRGSISQVVYTNIYDPNTQSTYGNQPYYVAAAFDGSATRNWIGGAGTAFDMQLHGRVTSMRAYSNTGVYTNNFRLVIVFDYTIKITSGYFLRFRLPTASWTLYKL